MTTPAPGAPTPGPATETPSTPAADPPTVDTPAPQDNPTPPANSEAARYRVERNEARAERDTLAARITALQRREAESVVADLLEQPADLWDLAKSDPASFYAEDDALDVEALRAAAGELLQSRPGLGKSQPQFGTGVPSHANWGQNAGAPPARQSWGKVLKG